MDVQVSSATVENRLRDIQSITDAELSHLDDHDFLAELLDRVKAVLLADTAAILLRDSASDQLIATAAAGLEEEVRQGVRIPVGKGFAGRIAAERRPVILDRVDHTTVLNPILLAKGIQSLLGVPLMASGKVIGVLHVGALTSRKFTSADAELLRLAAAQAAAAVQSLMNRDARVAVAALQRGLAPSALPALSGADMAARYVAGKGVVGGDWYDVFTLPFGELCVVIGDVTGSGLHAAVIMGRMRSALRAYAVDSRDPAEILRRLDRTMQYFEPDTLATVLCAVFDPALDRVHISLAGHFPPVIATPGQPATTVKVPPGAVLCFYTDGLIERPDQPIDHGLARLCQAVTAQPPELACAAVMGALVGREPARDDIALLVFQRQPQPPNSRDKA
jgi:sigma-B regulation protein RsbU (phosphoserine phosphatase)